MVDRLFDRPAFIAPPGVGYEPFEIHPRALTPTQCDRVIAAAEILEVDDASLETPEGSTHPDSAIRRSRTAWMAPTAENWWIYERLAAVIERSNRSYGFDIGGFDEDLQYTVYDEPGAFYTWHQDGLDATVAHRKLSVVVQLSEPDDYVGAGLEFLEVADDYDNDRAVDYADRSRARGAAIVFPSFEYHRVRPLERGIRRSLVAWVSGPPFR